MIDYYAVLADLFSDGKFDNGSVYYKQSEYALLEEPYKEGKEYLAIGVDKDDRAFIIHWAIRDGKEPDVSKPSKVVRCK